MAKTIIRTEADAVAWLKAEGSYEGLDLHEHDGATCVIVREECPRCFGRGHMGGGFGPWAWQTCFRCGGHAVSVLHKPLIKYAQAKKSAVTARENRRKREEERRAEYTAKMLEGQRRWCEENGYGPITFEERDKIRSAEREAAKAAKTWVGTIGKREEFTVTVVATPSWESRYGYHTQTVTCFIMETPEGNKVIWKSASFTELDKGVTARIKGTVKEHGEREGEKQTILTRVAVLEVIDPKPEVEKAAA